MMSGGANGGKGIIRLAAQDHIHGTDHGPDSPVGGGQTAG